MAPEPSAADPHPQLSMVVPAFNEEAMLDACIRIMSQTLCDAGLTHEIILVDDGSRDRTAEIAARLAREVAFVHVHHQLNQGIGGAFRTGVRASRGQYVGLWFQAEDGIRDYKVTGVQTCALPI